MIAGLKKTSVSLVAISSFAAVLFCLTISFAFASRSRPVESLHDLPAMWQGVAGGFLVRTPASLNIAKVLRVVREQRTDNGFSAVYDVEAAMSFAERKINIKQIALSRQSQANGRYEFTMFTDDELSGNLFGAILYDEATDSFTLKEYPKYGAGGERRFSFVASAPRP